MDIKDKWNTQKTTDLAKETIRAHVNSQALIEFPPGVLKSH